MEREEVLREWAKYIQPPEELAYSRIRKFPEHAVGRLVGVLDVDPSDRMLNVGSGVGIMARQLGGWLDDPENMVAIEPNEQLTELNVPESLNPNPGIVERNEPGEDIPFEDDSFDVVLSHTVLNVLPKDIRETIFGEMQRVVRPEGKIISMGFMVGDEYEPEPVAGTAEQAQRLEEFEDLHQEAHERVESGYYDTFKAMPDFFRQQGMTKVETRGWFHPFRLSDHHWTDQQRQDLIEWECRTAVARAETLRNLLEALDWWESSHGDLFEDVKEYYRQRRDRRREANQSDRESGWHAEGTLVVLGRPATD